MITKINNALLGAFVSAQSNAVSAAEAAQRTNAVGTRRGRTEAVAGAGLAYCLYLLTVPAFAAKDAQDSVVALINRFTNFVVILVAAISVLMGVFAALQFVGSGGNSAVAARAKSTIKNVVIGLVVCAGIFILKNAIITVVSAGSGGEKGTKDIQKTLENKGGLK